MARSLSLVSFLRTIHTRAGFTKAYPFLFFIVFSGAMLGFCLARLPYLNVGGSASSSFASSASPGEWYYYRQGRYRIGITLHLGTCLPAGILVIWQFVPAIRHKAVVLHRINGHVVIILLLLSNAGALMIARHAFGGSLDTQAGVGTLVILTTVSLTLAYLNIRQLQIEQHRAWMLRAIFYTGTIITTRLIMILAALIITRVGTYHQIMPCGEVAFIYDSMPKFLQLYPECLNVDEDTPIVVHAVFGGRPEQTGASLGLSFSMALWLAIILHVVGVEMYIGLTPGEGERLRRISYEKQLQNGHQNPGSSGLTSDKCGDADKWEPPSRASSSPEMRS